MYLFREGSKSTPIHCYAEFRLKTYAQTAFRFFRNAFGVDPSSFMVRDLFFFLFQYQFNQGTRLTE